jgi:capsule polysaccharide modification protein KpsS
MKVYDTVRWVWAIGGNGYLMYMLAMGYIRPNYLTADKEMFSNNKVLNMYRKLDSDNTITKRKNSNEKFHRKYNDKEKGHLLNQEYSLKYDFGKLQHLITNGEQILKLNNIESPDKMLWDKYLEVTGY